MSSTFERILDTTKLREKKFSRYNNFKFIFVFKKSLPIYTLEGQRTKRGNLAICIETYFLRYVLDNLKGRVQVMVARCSRWNCTQIHAKLCMHDNLKTSTWVKKKFLAYRLSFNLFVPLKKIKVSHFPNTIFLPNWQTQLSFNFRPPDEMTTKPTAKKFIVYLN